MASHWLQVAFFNDGVTGAVLAACAETAARQPESHGSNDGEDPWASVDLPPPTTPLKDSSSSVVCAAASAEKCKDRKKRGTVGTFKGRRPPKDAQRLADFLREREAHEQLQECRRAERRANAEQRAAHAVRKAASQRQQDFWKFIKEGMASNLIPGDDLAESDITSRPRSQQRFKMLCEVWHAQQAGIEAAVAERKAAVAERKAAGSKLSASDDASETNTEKRVAKRRLRGKQSGPEQA